MTDTDQGPKVERYGDLSPETREMLEGLTKEEVAFLQRLIRTIMSFGTVGRFLAYVIGALLGAVIGLPMLIDALARIWTWIPHKGP